jgi:hypothetical protein
MARIMLNKFIFLLIILFSWSTVVSAENCPANRAIYKSEDGRKTFAVTDIAINRAMYCHNKNDDHSYRVPTVGYLQLPSPTFEQMNTSDVQCNRSKDTFLKGMLDGQTTYLWSFFEKSLPCCGEVSFTQEKFAEEWPNDMLWLEGNFVPIANAKIDTFTNREYHTDYYTNGSQPLGETVYNLTGCSQ